MVVPTFNTIPLIPTLLVGQALRHSQKLRRTTPSHRCSSSRYSNHELCRCSLLSGCEKGKMVLPCVWFSAWLDDRLARHHGYPARLFCLPSAAEIRSRPDLVDAAGVHS